MKTNLLILGIMFPLGLLSQVGINTDDPQADLDVNGTVRIGKRVMENHQAKKLLGVDENGMIIELEMDENIFIEDNLVKSNTRREGVHNLTFLNIPVVNNVASIIWPGGTGNDKSVIRLNSLLLPDLIFTGLDMSGYGSPMEAHGTIVTLYSVSGKISLKDQNPFSFPQNRFALSEGTVVIKQYEMVKLMYDGILERWLIMTRD